MTSYNLWKAVWKRITSNLIRTSTVDISLATSVPGVSFHIHLSWQLAHRAWQAPRHSTAIRANISRYRMFISESCPHRHMTTRHPTTGVSTKSHTPAFIHSDGDTSVIQISKATCHAATSHIIKAAANSRWPTDWLLVHNDCRVLDGNAGLLDNNRCWRRRILHLHCHVRLCLSAQGKRHNLVK